MEGHAEMDMSVGGEGSLWRRMRSPRGFTAISDYFVMDWAAVWIDVFGGLLIAGALAAWVPNSFWQGLFLQHHGALSTIWGPLIGPLVAMLSFVCSIGNVPLAAVLWNGGISFGGVLAFIFADLIILPILNIYRKYYGRRMAALPARHLLRHDGRDRPDRRPAVQGARPRADRRPPREGDPGVGDLRLHHRPEHHLPRRSPAVLVRYFRKGGGLAMLRMMNTPMAERTDRRNAHGHAH